MTFIYIIISAILFYFVIRYGIRDGMVETEANKDKLIRMQKSNDLFGDISRIYFNLSRSKNEKNLEEDKKIYDDSIDMILSKYYSKDKNRRASCSYDLILFYYVIRQEIRDGMAEKEANKDKLIRMQKSNDLFGDISRIYFNLSRSKNEKNLEEAKKIYDDSLDMILSENDSKD